MLFRNTFFDGEIGGINDYFLTFYRITEVEAWRVS